MGRNETRAGRRRSIAGSGAIALALVLGIAGGPAQADIPADLEIKKTAASSQVAVGDPLEFVIAVQNIGRGAATDVQINDLLPAGYSWFQRTPVRSECSIITTDGRQRLKCSVPLINPDGFFVVRVKALSSGQCGQVSNTAVTRSEKEPAAFGANNTSTAVITVVCPD